jgi:MscS family membrane protein
MNFSSQFNSFINQQILGNRVENILWFAGFILVGLLLKKTISHWLSRILFRLVKKESGNMPITDFLKLQRRPVEMFITLLVIYTAFSFLRFPPEWKMAPISHFGLRLVILRSYQIFMIVTITWIILRFVDFFALVFTSRAEQLNSAINSQLIPFVKEMAKVLLSLCSIFVMLGTVFNLDVASIIAGLGIGGLAVALAAKESLENLFASFTIFLDKPFVVGDLVQVGNIAGTIEKVGFRSTRIRTLDKSFLTLPNKMLVDQALDNLTQRQFRRVKHFIGLTYDTPPSTLQAICEDIRQIIVENEHTQKETGTVHFTEFGESSLNILVVYFVESAEWSFFNKIKEEINFKIIDIVHKHGGTFAFPTHTIHIPQEDKTTILKNY